jgi:uncharacterized protein
MNLQPYTVRLYRSGPKADTFTDEELDRIQQGHLDFLAATRDSLFANGPFDNQPDKTLRGFAVMRTGIEETLAAVQHDPAVIAGRMRAEVFTWLVPEGMLRFGDA